MQVTRLVFQEIKQQRKGDGEMSDLRKQRIKGSAYLNGDNFNRIERIEGPAEKEKTEDGR